MKKKTGKFKKNTFQIFQESCLARETLRFPKAHSLRTLRLPKIALAGNWAFVVLKSAVTQESVKRYIQITRKGILLSRIGWKALLQMRFTS